MPATIRKPVSREKTDRIEIIAGALTVIAALCILGALVMLMFEFI